MNAPHYAGKPDSYFGNARTEIQPLLPAWSPRVLELGCGGGATLRWLRANQLAGEVHGIELFDEAAEAARPHLDSLCQLNIEHDTLPYSAASFDLILCLDVLEHLVDPWRAMAILRQLLAPGGVLVASVPNVRHACVSLPLLFGGHWRYRPVGILDKTHLRFFTRESALELIQSPGLAITQVRETGLYLRRNPYGIANLLTLGLLRPLFVVQYLIQARHAPMFSGNTSA